MIQSFAFLSVLWAQFSLFFFLASGSVLKFRSVTPNSNSDFPLVLTCFMNSSFPYIRNSRYPWMLSWSRIFFALNSSSWCCGSVPWGVFCIGALRLAGSRPYGRVEILSS